MPPLLPDGSPNYSYLAFGRWWEKPNLHACARGFDFHDMGLAHGKVKASARALSASSISTSDDASETLASSGVLSDRQEQTALFE